MFGKIFNWIKSFFGFGQKVTTVRDPRTGIQTYTGKCFYPLDPRPEEIDILDIAHALSLQCRFGGHCKTHYSIAQHSTLVSFYSGKHALWGLLHDASEAFIADLCKPVKIQLEMESYRRAEKRLMKAVCDKFNLPYQQPEDVTKADVLLLAAEARDLMSPLVPGYWRIDLDSANKMVGTIQPLSPEAAEKQFLDRFYELGGNMNVR